MMYCMCLCVSISRHPDELFEMKPESAVMDHTNAYVLRGQLLCAAKEEPLGRTFANGGL